MNNTLKLKFKFSDKNKIKAKKILKKYPKKFSRSAILPLLHLVQDQLEGWLSKDSIEYISKFLNVPLINVYEVASFYHMYNLKKVGKNCINVCTTTPCWLRGSDIILKKFEQKLNVKVGETTKDNLFSLNEIECLGACVDAPVIKINNNYYENLKLDDIQKIIKNLKR
ncbi:MAG: NADH-quinone oxidoreductase chain 2 [Alphaproteobacteria bacterium MarineAlpha6_Bin6]|nr:NADH-quinone oxidoreductase subunit NuoE [Pelagibacteraceae bacterium]PPR32331.1 MAG: NADH-quinone oxidoreductase chain 2 [Alphaproteobacteria bacterium MarineAlpha6_Bin6]PPR32939.1 MAG: NADH-quinone oxidoreductase chain 2 [Alphaproteobacteria bacterium MarineAlpha6_Bin5]|tara:strand:+ start:779 stop:1282 length:504 start_codon:yes stop_codon:yes gene_type:complete